MVLTCVLYVYLKKVETIFSGISSQNTTKRFRRETAPTSITIETAIYVDAYTTNVLNNSGLTTREQKKKALLIKWNGVSLTILPDRRENTAAISSYMHCYDFVFDTMVVELHKV